jgi:hypothetical protein
VVVIVLGLYYIAGAREGVTSFFHWTTWGRPLVLVGFTALVVAGIAPPILILFGAVDTAGAIWTAIALRRTPSAP